MYDVSLVQLIATPQQFHDKQVRVIGYLNLEFEGDALYLHQEDYEHSLTKNSVWISLSDQAIKNQFCSSNHYVLIEGRFNANNLGHMGLFSGSIDNVTRCEAMSEPNKPLQPIAPKDGAPVER